jgi:hypothetical protein
MDVALFTVATKMTVNNDHKASFYLSSWVQDLAPALLFPALYKHSKRKKRIVAEALTSDQWIRDVSHDLTVPLIDKLVQLWGMIEDVPFDPNNLEPDTILWTRTTSGDYSAKSAYELQFEGDFISKFPQLVWKVSTPSRCKFFM